MSKYRTLTQDELVPLEKEFVKFLVLNGMAGEDWVQLKENDKEAAEGIISSFSDVVFEQILRTTAYIEFIGDHDIYCIQCLHDRMILVGAKSDGVINFKTSDPNTIVQAGVKVYTTEKGYMGDRQKEIFDMLQSGYQITEGDLFKRLCLAL